MLKHVRGLVKRSSPQRRPLPDDVKRGDAPREPPVRRVRRWRHSPGSEASCPTLRRIISRRKCSDAVGMLGPSECQAHRELRENMAEDIAGDPCIALYAGCFQ